MSGEPAEDETDRVEEPMDLHHSVETEDLRARELTDSVRGCDQHRSAECSCRCKEAVPCGRVSGPERDCSGGHRERERARDDCRHTNCPYGIEPEHASDDDERYAGDRTNRERALNHGEPRSMGSELPACRCDQDLERHAAEVKMHRREEDAERSERRRRDVET